MARGARSVRERDHRGADVIAGVIAAVEAARACVAAGVGARVAKLLEHVHPRQAEVGVVAGAGARRVGRHPRGQPHVRVGAPLLQRGEALGSRDDAVAKRRRL